MAEGGGKVGRNVSSCRRREGHALSSSTDTDPGTWISPSPALGSRHLRREHAPSSAAEVHEDLLCPDEYHSEYEGDEHTCAFASDCAGPPCQGCEAVWKDEPFYGDTCRCCFGGGTGKSCRCRRDGPFKFPGTLIRASPNPQYIPGIAPPATVSSPTPTPDTCHRSKKQRDGRIQTVCNCCCNVVQHFLIGRFRALRLLGSFAAALQHAATHCDTPQHTATRCNTMQ